MKRFPLPRRSLRLVLVLVIAGLATAATVAFAGLQPADLTFTPKSEAQMTNIDVARAYAKNYYGAPTAVAGSGAAGTWDTPLNLQEQLRERGAFGRRQGRQLAGCTLEGARTRRSCSTSTTRR